MSVLFTTGVERTSIRPYGISGAIKISAMHQAIIREAYRSKIPSIIMIGLLENCPENL
jgi:hypothetical protein